MTAPASLGPPAQRPCASCPYRRDVPSGVWAAEEYAKLCRYDAPTPEQPPQVFLCHQKNRDATNSRVCAGWAGVHDGAHLLALRFAAMNGALSPEDVDAVIDYVSPVPLFASGSEAAKHGLAEICEPGDGAKNAMAKISRVRSDLLSTSSLPPLGDAVRQPETRDSIHAQCLALDDLEGRTSVCRKSKGHTNSENPRRREHYDTNTEHRWSDEEQAP